MECRDVAVLRLPTLPRKRTSQNLCKAPLVLHHINFAGFPAFVKTKEEGRRKKEEGWNIYGDLNPYLKVKKNRTERTERRGRE